jgi:hypothetical protein
MAARWGTPVFPGASHAVLGPPGYTTGFAHLPVVLESARREEDTPARANPDVDATAVDHRADNRAIGVDEVDQWCVQIRSCTREFGERGEESSDQRTASGQQRGGGMAEAFGVERSANLRGQRSGVGGG